jgi:protein-disulfide isomerase
MAERLGGKKRRKQEETQARLAAAGIRVPRKRGVDRMPIILVAIVLVVAVAVGLGVWYTRSSEEASATANYSVSASGAVVTAGNGPVVVDVYEDYLCPICERFEQRYGNEITSALNEHQITVRYHSIAILDRLTNPPGYSTRAANAALCAVPAGIYPQYHKKLFDEQPAEGGAGLANDQLIAFGTQLGAPADFAQCVNSGANANAVTAETEAATSDPALQTNGQFGTPTVAINGHKVDLSNTNWLQDAISGR